MHSWQFSSQRSRIRRERRPVLFCRFRREGGEDRGRDHPRWEGERLRGCSRLRGLTAHSGMLAAWPELLEFAGLSEELPLGSQSNNRRTEIRVYLELAPVPGAYLGRIRLHVQKRVNRSRSMYIQTHESWKTFRARFFFSLYAYIRGFRENHKYKEGEKEKRG